MTTELVMKALKNAYDTQKPGKDLILHTDFGLQYTSDKFRNYIKSLNIQQSFNRKECPDNVCIKSFYAILKKER